MRLNNLKPADGAKQARRRVGRGTGSGLGKTCGRGHKGQHSRAGGFHKVGFEGGQMPLQRRLPKVGFTSRTGLYKTEVRLHELAGVSKDNIIDLAALIAANVINRNTRQVKVIASGKLAEAVTLRGIAVTRGARAAIEAAGGKIED